MEGFGGVWNVVLLADGKATLELLGSNRERHCIGAYPCSALPQQS
jgi:hypothetical protein